MRPVSVLVVTNLNFVDLPENAFWLATEKHLQLMKLAIYL